MWRGAAEGGTDEGVDRDEEEAARSSVQRERGLKEGGVKALWT